MNTTTKKLDKVIKIENEDYNIYANTAAKVENILTIKNSNLASGVSDTSIEFDGSRNREIQIVPASGGKFNGPIRINNSTDLVGGDFHGEAVLNYNDIKTVLLKNLSNTSMRYYWSLNEGLITSTPKAVSADEKISGISVILGKESEVNDFARKNYNNEFDVTLPTYLYICSDTNILYYGTNLESAPTQIKTKVSGIIPETNGGTGKANLNDITVGTAKTALNANKIKTTFVNTEESSIQFANITISDTEPHDGNIGDIWIKY